jgi:hypothetical protein
VSERVNQIVWKGFPREEPLIVRDLSWLADSVVFGFNRPFGYHFGNVIYHSMALVLAFLLLLRITNATTALTATLLLLVLAAHVEPVAWIMGRKDVLSALFSFLSIHFFLNYQASEHQRSKNLSYAASFIFAGAAFLSKINAVILPGILFLLALITQPTFIRDGFGTQNLLKMLGRKLAEVVPFLVLGLLAFIWYRSVIAEFGMLNRNLEYTTEEIRRLIFIVNPLIFLEYLKMVFFPWNLEAYYTAPSIFSKFSGWHVALALLVSALTILGTAFLWRRNRVTCLFVLCFLLALLPYANWVHFGFWYANRYVYFASFFLISATACLLVPLVTRPTYPLVKILSVVILLGVFLHNGIYRSQYLGVWRDGETLWTHEIELPGASIRDYNNLTANYIGKAEQSAGEDKRKWLEKAQSVNDRGFQLDVPDHEQVWLAPAHYYSGLILSHNGAPLEEQLGAFLTAVENSSGYTRAQWSTAVVYYRMAVEETDKGKQLDLAELAMDYFGQNFEARQGDPRMPADRSNIIRAFSSEFPDLPLDKLQGN